MGKTAYCKKCGQDVPVGETCPLCGGKLAKGSARVAWCVERAPVGDWISWNGALRIMAPAAGAALLLTLGLEALAGGWGAAGRLLSQGLLLTWGVLCLAALGATGLILWGQGRELLDCVLDAKGAHATVYLLDPTPLQLLCRLRSPALLKQGRQGPSGVILPLETREIPWKAVARVQLWPGKPLILLYAPAWWLRLALPASAGQYDAALDYIQEKLGRRRDVRLPQALRAAPKPRKARAAAPQAAQPGVGEAALSAPEAAAMGELLAQMRQAFPGQEPGPEEAPPPDENVTDI